MKRFVGRIGSDGHFLRGPSPALELKPTGGLGKGREVIRGRLEEAGDVLELDHVGGRQLCSMLWLSAAASMEMLSVDDAELRLVAVSDSRRDHVTTGS